MVSSLTALSDPPAPEAVAAPKLHAGYMTSFILLGYGLGYAVADARADLQALDRMLAEEACAYGKRGKVLYPYCRLSSTSSKYRIFTLILPTHFRVIFK